MFQVGTIGKFLVYLPYYHCITWQDHFPKIKPQSILLCVVTMTPRLSVHFFLSVNIYSLALAIGVLDSKVTPTSFLPLTSGESTGLMWAQQTAVCPLTSSPTKSLGHGSKQLASLVQSLHGLFWISEVQVNNKEIYLLQSYLKVYLSTGNFRVIILDLNILCFISDTEYLAFETQSIPK